MKLSNIFKKSTKTVSKSNVETLAKNQLEKVIGGSGPDVPLETSSQVVKSKSNVKNN